MVALKQAGGLRKQHVKHFNKVELLSILVFFAD
jgi:hypothetical protein